MNDLTEPDDLSLYRPNIGICLINPQRKIFLGRATPRRGGHWHMPQGGRRPLESLTDGFNRELEEETSIRKQTAIVAVLADEQIYDFPEDDRRSSWYGQRQTWVFALFNGSDANVFINRNELDQKIWADPGQVLDKAPQGRKEIYPVVIAAGFLPIYQAMEDMPAPSPDADQGELDQYVAQLQAHPAMVRAFENGTLLIPSVAEEAVRPPRRRPAVKGKIVAVP